MIVIIADDKDDDAFLVKKILNEKFGKDCVIFNFDFSDIGIRVVLDNEKEDVIFQKDGIEYNVRDFNAV